MQAREGFGMDEACIRHRKRLEDMASELMTLLARADAIMRKCERVRSQLAGMWEAVDSELDEK
jgi:hypothetical protein|tara:strand:- start:434 stop:622 length:189 start_codon:yes stop_codon:yes gene_type:complete